jgi:hypothetical protein
MGKPLQLILKFVGKARRVENLKDASLKGKFQPYSQTLE